MPRGGSKSSLAHLRTHLLTCLLAYLPKVPHAKRQLEVLTDLIDATFDSYGEVGLYDHPENTYTYASLHMHRCICIATYA